MLALVPAGLMCFFVLIPIFLRLMRLAAWHCSSDRDFCFPCLRTIKPSNTVLKRPSKSCPIRECLPFPTAVSVVGLYSKYLESVALHFHQTNGLRNTLCCSWTFVTQSLVHIFEQLRYQLFLQAVLQWCAGTKSVGNL